MNFFILFFKALQCVYISLFKIKKTKTLLQQAAMEGETPAKPTEMPTTPMPLGVTEIGVAAPSARYANLHLYILKLNLFRDATFLRFLGFPTF